MPFPSPMHESESEVAQSCLTLSDPMDCSPPGPSIHGSFQARVLEWGAIAFSDTSSRRMLSEYTQTCVVDLLREVMDGMLLCGMSAGFQF